MRVGKRALKMTDKNTYDVIMVGSGVMGCATAYYLLNNDPQIKVAIVEKDPTYEFNSSVLSDANIRLQFNIKENILISQYGLDALETFAEDMKDDGVKPDVAFRQQGNLFLADDLVGINFDFNRQLFIDMLWPELVEFIPEF